MLVAPPSAVQFVQLAPQWAESVLSAQALVEAQKCSPTGHPSHWPATHDVPPVHAWPHVPQLALSVNRLAHVALTGQNVVPGAQLQTHISVPLLHVFLPGQPLGSVHGAPEAFAAVTLQDSPPSLHTLRPGHPLASLHEVPAGRVTVHFSPPSAHAFKPGHPLTGSVHVVPAALTHAPLQSTSGLLQVSVHLAPMQPVVPRAAPLVGPGQPAVHEVPQLLAGDGVSQVPAQSSVVDGQAHVPD
jgi:hypothetical protein